MDILQYLHRPETFPQAQDEAWLRERLHLDHAARHFAKGFPEPARQLGLDTPENPEPVMETLLQGVAHVHADISRRLDDDLPEIAGALLEQLWPGAMSAYPSCTVLAFQHRLRGGTAQTVPAGALVETDPVGHESTRCRFRTVTELSLHSLELVDVEAQDTPAGTRLSLHLEVHDPRGAPTILPDHLDLYAADPRGGADLVHAIRHHTRELILSVEGQGERPVRGSRGVDDGLRPWQSPMVPWVDASHAGLHLLQDYLHFPEAFRFIRLYPGVRETLPRGVHRFTLHLQLDVHLPASIPLTGHSLRLHCIPAINLFEHTAEPIPREPGRSRYPVLADAQARQSIHTHRVQQIIGIDSTNAQRREYRSALAHDMDRVHPLYQALPRPGPDRTWQTWLELDPAQALSRETLSCRLLVHNGDLPHRHLSPGTPAHGVKDIPDTVKISHLIRPTPHYPPTDRTGWRWDLVSLACLRRQGLMSTTALQRVLQVIDRSGDPSNQRRLQGLGELRVTPCNRMVRGAVLHGQDARLQVDADHFPSEADRVLFASVLERFLNHYAGLNSFIRLHLEHRPAGRPTPGSVRVPNVVANTMAAVGDTP
ncbi:type VI secretion system baseplate subunit TssF [Ectothiorhodospira marina]|uniref:Type VI secretion system protein ImpG n=1 Tax=Ectothiorhodospira marina TaxID=1396821 RepID=A0A1H7IYU9_9GAMM|nr:type VI secretion system baseplate subunit TssF [Ectothiorhodospira marina]SEK67578.1 type VI secretion system protein ImpG [Ectothiorhodospira marina]